MSCFKLKYSQDFKKIQRRNKNSRTKARRRERKREFKSSKPTNAMDVVKTLSDQRKKNGATMYKYN